MSAGGRNLIYLGNWNRVAITKLLSNVCAKKDSLWMLWIHLYYIKDAEPRTYNPPIHSSWSVKALFKHNDTIFQMETWKTSNEKKKCSTKRMNKELQGITAKVMWRKIFFRNLAKPQASFILWLACRRRQMGSAASAIRWRVAIIYFLTTAMLEQCGVRFWYG